MGAELKKAHDLYVWLWLSPLLTIPTLAFFLFNSIGYELVCRGSGVCNWHLAETISLVLAVLLSSLWHFLLLKPALNRDSPLVRWHALQSLCLAGLRTVVPLGLAFAIAFGEDEVSLLLIPVLILIWFTGSYLGQNEAAKGKCWLAERAGREAELAPYQRLALMDEVQGAQADAIQEWVNIIRFDDDSQKRHQALEKLIALDMVEDF